MNVQKIPSLYKRDYESTRLVIDEVVEGCEWVLAGEGVTTEKFDGTACAVIMGKLFRRLHVKEGQPPPGEWIHWSRDAAVAHGHGWAPVGDGPGDRWHREAFGKYPTGLADGTYELMGPKIQKNPKGLPHHALWRHGAHTYPVGPQLSFEGIRTFLANHFPDEGIVWHHPDGRMVKIKTRDFGLRIGGKK